MLIYKITTKKTCLQPTRDFPLYTIKSKITKQAVVEVRRREGRFSKAAAAV